MVKKKLELEDEKVTHTLTSFTIRLTFRPREVKEKGKVEVSTSKCRLVSPPTPGKCPEDIPDFIRDSHLFPNAIIRSPTSMKLLPATSIHKSRDESCISSQTTGSQTIPSISQSSGSYLSDNIENDLQAAEAFLKNMKTRMSLKCRDRLPPMSVSSRDALNRSDAKAEPSVPTTATFPSDYSHGNPPTNHSRSSSIETLRSLQFDVSNIPRAMTTTFQRLPIQAMITTGAVVTELVVLLFKQLDGSLDRNMIGFVEVTRTRDLLPCTFHFFFFK
ncbi:unnamed protein product, partial [Mesorhabditis belari]|uniref:Uncharacterized protein n=1 Tax=Mesorhabditis belari TaxID=2138241 RepID=A0AAF3F7E4_9BILA